MNRINLIIVLSIIFSPFLYPHGVDILTINGGTGIEARYDSGDPISYAEVTVYSPENEKEPFQSGVTDRNGRFLFFPDLEGEWKIVVNDWTGHGGTFRIKVDPSLVSITGDGVGTPGRGIKILSGISVIFGLSGLLFYLVAIRERKRGRNAHS